MANFNWKSVLRVILMKTMGVIVALILLPIALFFLSYPFVSLITSRAGEDAKIALVSDHFNKIKTGSRVGGIFTVATEKSGAKKDSHHKTALNENIYCLYPVWPDQLQPSKGDLIHVWPAKKPLLGEPSTEGWGWFIAGTVFVLGLVLLEFVFLALTMA
ncbi:MAG TPA: hypothetical protein VJ873_03015 [bacterium]|nr:hypothetical protein [bacterium]